MGHTGEDISPLLVLLPRDGLVTDEKNYGRQPLNLLLMVCGLVTEVVRRVADPVEVSSYSNPADVEPQVVTIVDDEDEKTVQEDPVE